MKELEQTQRIVQETLNTMDSSPGADAAPAHTCQLSDPQAHGDGEGSWERTVRNNLELLQRHAQETVWPKDALFQFFLLMEALQENLEERAELLRLANEAVVNLQDD